MSDLQEADRHEEHTVGADPAGEDLVQIPLQQELLQHQHQVRQGRELLQEQTQDRHSFSVDSDLRWAKAGLHVCEKMGFKEVC